MAESSSSSANNQSTSGSNTRPTASTGSTSQLSAEEKIANLKSIEAHAHEWMKEKASDFTDQSEMDKMIFAAWSGQIYEELKDINSRLASERDNNAK
ncbi:uncharacterized protein L201_000401 [Kwoniella dendrophila CBS 6074]|uniref:Uncharacterized protein n=1 Tax=Kwoniella dendrophila CBS 6074 TaxID=1295534 RepID=A0AAX4JJC8_9TREE